jgi:hypothetical protein
MIDNELFATLSNTKHAVRQYKMRNSQILAYIQPTIQNAQ